MTVTMMCNTQEVVITMYNILFVCSLVYCRNSDGKGITGELVSAGINAAGTRRINVGMGWDGNKFLDAQWG